MKNFGIIHILLFLLIMLVYQCAAAQDFLVTTKGDTLQGNIKLLTGVEKKVQVIGSDKKKTVFQLYQVSFFNLKGEIYKPVKGPNGYAFMKLLKAGYLSLYAFQLENQTLYEGRLLVKKDGQFREVPNLTFKKVMKDFMEDCQEVANNIEAGQYAKKDLEKLIDDYNTCIENKSIAFQKNIEVKTASVKKLGAWEALEEKVKAQPDFEGKGNALDMMTEIKNKISKAEKVPNFLIDGLKSTLPQPELQEYLQAALVEIK